VQAAQIDIGGNGPGLHGAQQRPALGFDEDQRQQWYERGILDDAFSAFLVRAELNASAPKHDESRFHNWFTVFGKPIRLARGLRTRVLASFSEC